MAEAATTPAISVTAGAVLAGKYRVERELGIGGMGVVVEATHLHLDERVAMKLLLPSLIHDEEFKARFFREGRAAVKIRSEHVTRVLDVGALEDGQPYIVMELLEGQDLGRVIERGALPIAVAVDYVLQAAHAIAEAHAAGIVHRDLKPSNLFLTHRGDGTPCVKVMDFGISKVVDPNKPDMSLTRTATVMGSPLYMAPEQMRSTRQVDARADVWALGTILYEFLAGKVPFDAATMPELCAMILQDPPPKLRARRPEIPHDLEATVERCLSKRPDDRFASVAAFAASLAPFGSDEGRALSTSIAKMVPRYPSSTPSLADVTGSQPSLPAARSSGGLAGARTEPGWTTRSHEAQKNRALFVIGAAAVVACFVVGVAVFAVTRKHDEAKPSATAAPPPSALASVAPSATAVVTATSEPVVPPAPSASVALPSASSEVKHTTKTAPHPHPKSSAAPTTTAAPSATTPPPSNGLATDRHG